MDSVFIKYPALLLFLAAILCLHILSKLLKAPMTITVINGAVHAAALSAILLFGGNLEDALLLVLFSAVFAFFATPKDTKSDTEEDK